MTLLLLVLACVSAWASLISSKKCEWHIHTHNRTHLHLHTLCTTPSPSPPAKPPPQRAFFRFTIILLVWRSYVVCCCRRHCHRYCRNAFFFSPLYESLHFARNWHKGEMPFLLTLSMTTSFRSYNLFFAPPFVYINSSSWCDENLYIWYKKEYICTHR